MVGAAIGPVVPDFDPADIESSAQVELVVGETSAIVLVTVMNCKCAMGGLFVSLDIFLPDWLILSRSERILCTKTNEKVLPIVGDELIYWACSLL